MSPVPTDASNWDRLSTSVFGDPGDIDATSDRIVECLRQNRHITLDLSPRDDQRRGELEHIRPVAGIVQHQSELSRPVDGDGCQRSIWLAWPAWPAIFGHQLDSLDQPETADLPHGADAAEHIPESRVQIGAG